jgi:hypothetical protein
VLPLSALIIAASVYAMVRRIEVRLLLLAGAAVAMALALR